MYPITVFTLTYNRAYCLNTCYLSLQRQTCKDFEWLIVDDGSTDETRDLIKAWIEEGLVPIRYVYKKNGGMHTGYNVAYDNIDSELAVCIDSDDYMTDDAIDKILSFWKKHGDDRYAGIAGLDITKDNQVIGTSLPNIKSATVYDLYYRLGVKGDKKMVYRTELMKPIKSPEYPGEKLFATRYRYYEVDKTHEMLLLNEPLCVVEYMPDGYTRNIFKSYKNNLNSYIFYRKYVMSYPSATLKHKFMYAIHYVAESLLNHDKRFIKHSPSKMLTVLAVPGGILFYVYILVKG